MASMLMGWFFGRSNPINRGDYLNTKVDIPVGNGRRLSCNHQPASTLFLPCFPGTRVIRFCHWSDEYARSRAPVGMAINVSSSLANGGMEQPAGLCHG